MPTLTILIRGVLAMKKIREYGIFPKFGEDNLFMTIMALEAISVVLIAAGAIIFR